MEEGKVAKIKKKKEIIVVAEKDNSDELRKQIESSIRLALSQSVLLYGITPKTDIYSMIVDLELLIRKFDKI